MKRLIAISIALASLLCILPAAAFSDYAKAESYIPDSFLVGMGNDKWAIGGISYNFDDQLSFSEHFTLSAPAYRLKVNMLAFTNRGWRDGWSVTDPSAAGGNDLISGRYDATEILLSIPLDIVSTDLFSLRLEAEGGLSVVGNQHYDVLQNTLHKLIHASPVNLGYEIEGNNLYGMANASVDMAFSLYSFENAKLFASAEARSENTIGFDYMQRAEGSIGLRNSKEDILSLSLGYTWAETETQWSTARLYREYLRGLTFGMTINTGSLRLEYSTSLRSHFGFGTISIDVLSFLQPKEWKESNIYMNMGTMNLLNAQFFTVGLEVPIKDSGFALTTETRFISGNPSFKGWETDMDPAAYPRFKRSYDGFYIGGKYSFSSRDTHGWITPYAKASAGIMRWETRTLLNMIDYGSDIWKEEWTYTEETGSGTVTTEYWPEEWQKNTHSILYSRLYSFSMDAEFGFTILPESFITSATTSFQINIFGGVTMIHNAKAVESYLNTITDDSNKLAMLMPRWGISLRLGFDI